MNAPYPDPRLPDTRKWRVLGALLKLNQRPHGEKTRSAILGALGAMNAATACGVPGGGEAYGRGLNAAAFVLCGLGFGVILGISLMDVVPGGALSIVSSGLTGLAVHSQSLTTLLELIVAAVAAVLTTTLGGGRSVRYELGD